MILEDLMLDLMYYLPSFKKVREFVVTKEMVSDAEDQHGLSSKRQARIASVRRYPAQITLKIGFIPAFLLPHVVGTSAVSSITWSRQKIKSDTKRLPMMPIRDVVIFPYMMTPFVVGRESSVRALEEALAGDKKIFLATQHDASVDEPRPDEIYSVGTIANIVQSLKLPDGNIKVLVEGVERGKIVSVTEDEGFFRAVVRTIRLPGGAGQPARSSWSAASPTSLSSTSSSART